LKASPLVSENLAAVTGYACKKKFALLHFDLQKTLKKQNQPKRIGLIFLKWQCKQNVSSIYTKSPDIPGLHIFSTGVITNNSSDLLLSNNLGNLYSAH